MSLCTLQLQTHSHVSIDNLVCVIFFFASLGSGYQGWPRPVTISRTLSRTHLTDLIRAVNVNTPVSCAFTQVDWSKSQLSVLCSYAWLTTNSKITYTHTKSASSNKWGALPVCNNYANLTCSNTMKYFLKRCFTLLTVHNYLSLPNVLGSLSFPIVERNSSWN